ncbi:MAG: methionyl-tRNA formyltransferase [Patescibacteria group bacterium]
MSTTPLNYVFFGTPEFSTLVLAELLSKGYSPAFVVTTPDKPAGRGLALTESPVKIFATKQNIPVLQPEKLDAEFVSNLKEKNLDLCIVAAYGKILPESLLSITKYPPLNVHPSLLPKYRGTSPVESQILADEKNIGVSVIRMDEKTDHGPIVAQEKVEIPNWPISRDTLNTILWKKGGALIAQALPSWIDGSLKEIPQNHDEATPTPRTQKTDGLVELLDSDRKNYLKYLAYEGWPGTYFFSEKDGKKIRVIIKKARLLDEKFVIDTVLPEGKKEMGYEDFLKGKKVG